MCRYMRKPGIIDAFEFKGFEDFLCQCSQYDWIKSAHDSGEFTFRKDAGNASFEVLVVKTPVGYVNVKKGDFVIQSNPLYRIMSAGEFYRNYERFEV